MTGRERKAQVDGERLMAEIAGYLAAVEAFRAEGREPRWRAESRPQQSRKGKR